MIAKIVLATYTDQRIFNINQIMVDQLFMHLEHKLISYTKIEEYEKYKELKAIEYYILVGKNTDIHWYSIHYMEHTTC